MCYPVETMQFHEIHCTIPPSIFGQSVTSPPTSGKKSFVRSNSDGIFNIQPNIFPLHDADRTRRGMLHSPPRLYCWIHKLISISSWWSSFTTAIRRFDRLVRTPPRLEIRTPTSQTSTSHRAMSDTQIPQPLRICSGSLPPSPASSSDSNYYPCETSSCWH